MHTRCRTEKRRKDADQDDHQYLFHHFPVERGKRKRGTSASSGLERKKKKGNEGGPGCPFSPLF